MKSTIALLTVLSLCVSTSVAQERQARDRSYPPTLEGASVEVYKTIGDVKLNIYIYYPEGHKPTDKRGAIVFFFGGGWRNGTPAQFQEHCRYLASRGMVAMTADYRVSSRHGTKVVHCVADGKSAVRWIRANAKRLGVDADRIAAGGGSAGGHVAACTGVIPGLDSADEDAFISSVPNAMALFNPALVLARVDGRALFDEDRLRSLAQRIGDEPKSVSPYHHVSKGAPPTIIFHGKADSTVPYRTAEVFATAMNKVGNRCELVGYDDQAHGFFNFGRGDGSHYVKTVQAMDQFLASLGFLAGEPTIDQD